MGHVARTRRLGPRTAAVAALALVVGMGAAAPVTAAEPGAPDHVTRILALRTGATSSVTLLDPTTLAVGGTQSLASRKGSCELISAGKNLVAFSSSPASPGVGIAGPDIGVRASTTASGTSCSAVDASASESLVLTVGTDATAGSQKLVAAAASLDIELKQAAEILATASLGGTTVGTFRLVSGTGTGTLPPNTQLCNATADSGPDSGTNSHCRWQINAPSWTGDAKSTIGFDTLALKAVRGSFSLQGGGDGNVDDPADPMPASLGAYRYASIVELVPTLDCGQTSSTARSATVSSTWQRLGNSEGGACVAYPYWNTTGVDAVGAYAHFQKPLQLETDAQSLWTTTFVYTGPVPVPTITLEYLDAAGQPSETTSVLAACPDGFVPGTSPAPPAPSACLVSTTKTTSKGVKYVTFVVYVHGDARLRV